MAARVIRAPEGFFEASEMYRVPSSSANHYQRPTKYSHGDYYPTAHPDAYLAANPADAHSSSAARLRFIAPALDASCFQSPSTFDWSLSTFDGSPSALDDYSFEAENPAIEAFQNTSPHSLLPSYASFASHDFAERDADEFAYSARHRHPSAASWSGGGFNAASLPQNLPANGRAFRASRVSCDSRISCAPPRGACAVRGPSDGDCASVMTGFGDTVARGPDGCDASPSATPAISAAVCGRGMIVQAAGARRRPAIGIKKLRELEAAKQRTATQAASAVEQAHAQVAAAAEANAVAVAQAEEVAEASVGTAAEEVPQLHATRTVRRPLQPARSNSTPPEVTEMAAMAAIGRGGTAGGTEAARSGGDDSGEPAGDGGTATMITTTTCMGHAESRFRTNREERAAIFGLHSTSAPPELAAYDDRRDSRLRASNGRGVPAMFPPPVARRPSLESLESPHQASSSRSPSQSPSVRHAPSLQSRSSLPPLQSHLHRHRNSQSRSRSPSPSPSPLQSNRARSPLRAPLRHSSQAFADPLANSPSQRFSEDRLRPVPARTTSDFSEKCKADAQPTRSLHATRKARPLGFPRSGSVDGGVRRNSAISDNLISRSDGQSPFGLYQSAVSSHHHMRRGSLPTVASSRMESTPARLYRNSSIISAAHPNETCKSSNSSSPSQSPSSSKPHPSLFRCPSPPRTSLHKLPSDNLDGLVTSTHYNRYMQHGALRQKSRLGLRTTSVDLGDIAAGSARAGLAAQQARNSSGSNQGEVDVGEVQQGQEQGNLPHKSFQSRTRPNSLSVWPSAYTPLSPYEGAIVARTAVGPAVAVAAATDAAQHSQQHCYKHHSPQRQQHEHHSQQQQQHRHYLQHQHQQQQQQQQQRRNEHVSAPLNSNSTASSPHSPPQQLMHSSPLLSHSKAASRLSPPHQSHSHSPPHETIRSRRALPSLAVHPLFTTRASPASILRTSSLATNITASTVEPYSSLPLLFPLPGTTSSGAKMPVTTSTGTASTGTASPATTSPCAASAGVSPARRISPCRLPKSILTVRQEGSIGRTRSLGRLVRFNKVAEVHVIL
ncbi:unnamed protein product [Closterium sp. NIES-53]